MKLTDIRNSINEISAIGGLKMVVKGNTKEVEGIKLSKEMAQAMIDWFNSSPYGRKYPKAAKARLHISLGIMMSFGLERYAKHKGAKEELKYIKGLSKRTNESVNEDDNPCWKNYQMVGMKKKNGKDVPNCVPEGLKEGVMSDIHLTIKSSSSEEDFIKKFFKKYGKQVKPNKESILWVKDLYSDTKNESVTEAKEEPIVALLKLGLFASKGTGEKKLLRLSDDFEEIGDEQADEIASHLNMAIELFQDGYSKAAVPVSYTHLRAHET